MTTVQTDLKAELAKRLKSLEETLPPTPQELAERAFDQAQRDEAAAGHKLGAVRADLEAHADKLRSLPLDDIPAWSARTAELNALYAAMSDYVRMKNTQTEAARTRMLNLTQQPDPRVIELRHRLWGLNVSLQNLSPSQPADDLIRQMDEVYAEIEALVGREFVELK